MCMRPARPVFLLHMITWHMMQTDCLPGAHPALWLYTRHNQAGRQAGFFLVRCSLVVCVAAAAQPEAVDELPGVRCRDVWVQHLLLELHRCCPEGVKRDGAVQAAKLLVVRVIVGLILKEGKECRASRSGGLASVVMRQESKKWNHHSIAGGHLKDLWRATAKLRRPGVKLVLMQLQC